MPLINLHNHSNKSDGTLPPGSVLEMAVKEGIEYFALTDHDTVLGCQEIEQLLPLTGVNYCHGIEITVAHESDLHILGYGIDIFSTTLITKLREFQKRRLSRLHEILAALSKAGVVLKFSDLSWRGGCLPGVNQIAEAIANSGYAKNSLDAHSTFLAPGKPGGIPSDGPSASEAITAIKSAGGKAVLAHPKTLKSKPDLSLLKDLGLDGIEAYYPTHTPEETSRYAEFARRHGLFITAGIDFHGPPFERAQMNGFRLSPEQMKGISGIFQKR